MPTRTTRIIMNGITGRMGYRQHLLRSILAIRDDGGVQLPNGDRLQVEPILVGRNAERVSEIAERHGVEEWTTDLDGALSDDTAAVYFDAQLTNVRKDSILRAIDAGKHIYTEKPTAETTQDAATIAEAAERAGIIHGVVHDKLYLPGLLKLKRLIDADYFGRILSVRGEFGYWVFEGDIVPAQRPSWNYRAADGGGIVLDMFCHWNYVLENLFGAVQSVYSRSVTHIPQRWDEQGRPYDADADDAAYAIFELEGGTIAQVNSSWATRVDRDELVEFHVDGTHGSAVAGLFGCRIQPRVQTPMPVWNPDVPMDIDLRAEWEQIPDNAQFPNGFRAQWEQFLTDVDARRPHPYDLRSGERGLRLVEAAYTSSAEGRRVDIGTARA
jgi:predicted dehydrogenase